MDTNQRRQSSVQYSVFSIQYSVLSRSRFAGAEDAEGETAAILEGFDGGGDFQDAIADSVQAVGFVGPGEEFGFDDAGPVGDGEEFHGLAGNLMEEALLDDEAAGDDLLAEVFAEVVDRAVGVPGDVGGKFEGMAAGGDVKVFVFTAQALEAGGLGEEVRNAECRVRSETEFRIPHSAFHTSLEFPVLGGAGFAEVVEGAGANQ